ncbi:two-component system KDP operon response regulator KdpE [Lachnotalea glycerini]|uniref:Stage 0 sporulation protein A homolog n=1 Tax=Lachnotalea glycerini TaxID=1763509 RepID=A0A318ERQ6_9FIRM|nr:response regulator [Lachnotalea glycerini]PXV95631.1 two-component system KDP operon response regulator KdpE [Lachnotalea glycerini]
MSNYNETILIVEDDPQIRNFIKYTIEKEGFQLFSAANAQNALNIIVTEKIDLIILDLGLPDFDGIEVIRKVREWSETPIIVVSARDQDKEKVLALDTGADDYITKPFSATELLARIRVAIRHLYKKGIKAVQPYFLVGDLKIDFESRIVSVAGTEIHLTPNEYNLLNLLSKNAGKVITTGSILKEIWGMNYGSDTQALRALMAGLRRKVEKTPAKPRYIITEIGVGYRLVDE